MPSLNLRVNQPKLLKETVPTLRRLGISSSPSSPATATLPLTITPYPSPRSSYFPGKVGRSPRSVPPLLVPTATHPATSPYPVRESSNLLRSYTPTSSPMPKRPPHRHHPHHHRSADLRSPSPLPPHVSRSRPWPLTPPRVGSPLPSPFPGPIFTVPPEPVTGAVLVRPLLPGEAAVSDLPIIDLHAQERQPGRLAVVLAHPDPNADRDREHEVTGLVGRG